MQPKIIEYIRRSKELEAVVSFADIIYAYTLYPDYFEQELKEVQVRMLVPTDDMEAYLSETITAYEERLAEASKLRKRDYTKLGDFEKGQYRTVMKNLPKELQEKILLSYEKNIKKHIEPVVSDIEH